ncbi:MFS transporter [Streptomyces sp. BK239]|uniref:MFS transporter n=1 Tax=Streptomyces sp. BK239 TaxID=2512155 RepID=UPI00102BAE5B|nr:MFS transporter [Streptomyces sp. BK239]RZU22042.1 MFS transporter [Streptomyces sp. BK239]
MRTSPPQRLLALAQLSNSVGDGAYYTTSALYFTQIAGLAPARVGLGLTVGWAVGSLAGVPLGRLADRRGPRGTAVLLALATGLAVASFTLVRDFLPFVLVASGYAAAQSGLAAARQALLAGLVPAGERTGLLARLQATLNAGLAVGAGLGGLALHAGSRSAYVAVFVVDAVSFVVCALLLLGLPRVPCSAECAVSAVSAAASVASVASGTEGRGRLGGVLRDRPYAVVALLNTVLLLRLPLLSLVLPLWITSRTGAPAWLVSALFVLNTAVVTLFQVRAARGVTGLDSATRVLRRSGWVMCAACAVFALSAGTSPWVATGVLVLGALLQVVAEMGQSAGSWQLSFDLAPADRVGEYQGLFGTGVTVARTLGPLLLTWLLVEWGTPGWLLLGTAMLAASYAMGPVSRHAARAGEVSRTRGLTPANVVTPR